MNGTRAKPPSLIVFRADGGQTIGAGHVARSLALASIFHTGGWSIGFAASAETFESVAALHDWPLERLILTGNMSTEAEEIRARWPSGADIFVVDHYERDATLERACRGWARRIVVIDDLANRPHDTDVLVDVANPQDAYRPLVPSACTVLVGLQHAIVHPAFRDARSGALARRAARSIERVFVSFGQVDALNATTHALNALDAIGFNGHVDVVLGGAAPHLAAVRARKDERIRIHVDVAAGGIARLMAKADFAIGAGGVTALERCCLGLPSALVTVADNQARIVAMLRDAGAAVDAGRAESGLEKRLAHLLRQIFREHGLHLSMAKAAEALVDGRGIERVALAAIGSWGTKNAGSVSLRLASADDEAWLFDLQSQPETRRYANDPSPPEAKAHHQWMARTLADPDRLLMIAEINGQPVGMLRLDRREGGERVNIAIDRNFHRRGIGSAILGLAARLRPQSILDAEVLPGNDASLALFTGAGYRRTAGRLLRREPSNA